MTGAGCRSPAACRLSGLSGRSGALLVVLVLSQRSILLAVTLGVVGALLGAGRQGWSGAALLGAAGFVGTLAAGVLVGWLDWPLRLVVLPGMIATLAGQAAPDGRPAHRYLVSWVSLWLRSARRSLDRPVGVDGEVAVWAPQVWVAPDHHSPVLEHGRVRGPARLVFGRPVVVIPGRGRYVVRPAEGHRMRAASRLLK